MNIIDNKTLQLADQCKLNLACMELCRIPECLQMDHYPRTPVQYNLVTSDNVLTLYEIPEYRPITLKMFQELTDFKIPNVYGIHDEDMMEVLLLVQRSHPKMVELAVKLGWKVKRVFLTVDNDMVFIIRNGNGDYISTEYQKGALICLIFYESVRSMLLLVDIPPVIHHHLEHSNHST